MIYLVELAIHDQCSQPLPPQQLSSRCSTQYENDPIPLPQSFAITKNYLPKERLTNSRCASFHSKAIPKSRKVSTRRILQNTLFCVQFYGTSFGGCSELLVDHSLRGRWYKIDRWGNSVLMFWFYCSELNVILIGTTTTTTATFHTNCSRPHDLLETAIFQAIHAHFDRAITPHFQHHHANEPSSLPTLSSTKIPANNIFSKLSTAAILHNNRQFKLTIYPMTIIITIVDWPKNVPHAYCTRRSVI